MSNNELTLGEILKIFSNFTKRHKIILIIFIILSIAIGIFSYLTTKKYYRSEMVVTSNLVLDITKSSIRDIAPLLSILENLQAQTKAKNYPFLKNAFGNDDVEWLKNIKVSVTTDEALSDLQSNNIKIEVNVFDKEKLENFEAGLLNYCNKNVYLKNNFQEQKKSVQNIDKKIREADSMQKILLNSTNNDKIIVDLHKQNSEMELELKIERAKSLYTANQPIAIVQHINKTPVLMNRKIMFGAIAFILTLMVGFFVGLIVDIFKFIKNN